MQMEIQRLEYQEVVICWHVIWDNLPLMHVFPQVITLSIVLVQLDLVHWVLVLIKFVVQSLNLHHGQLETSWQIVE